MSTRARSLDDRISAPKLESLANAAERVRAAGLKVTPQRVAIVREIAHDPTHPTAQELYERLLPKNPSMSFATVYNTLDALASKGLCARRSMAPGAARFDPNMDPHDHAVCDVCGLVRDVIIAADRQPRVVIAADRRPPVDVDGFVVESVEQIYRGRCRACAAAEPFTPQSSRKS